MKFTLLTIMTLLISPVSFGKDNIEKALLKRLDSENCSINNYPRNSRIKVAILDSGLDGEYKDNPVYKSNKRKVSSVNYKREWAHGTHVQGIVYMLNKKSSLYHYNFYTSYIGEENLKSLLNKLSTITKTNARVVNISLGGPLPDNKELNLMARGQKRGQIFVLAAGNDGKNIELKENGYFPASYVNLDLTLDNFITVANFHDEKKLHEKSNYGKNSVFIGAIGTNVPSYSPLSGNYIEYMTGTSQATPIITSAISLLLQRYPYLTVAQIKHILSENSIKNKVTLKYTKVGLFSWKSFVKWMNKDYTLNDLFPNRKDLVSYFKRNPNYVNTKNNIYRKDVYKATLDWEYSKKPKIPYITLLREKDMLILLSKKWSKK